MAKSYFTREGYEKLQKDLEDLRKQRTQLSEEVGRARELGDLRENAEYHAAREKLAMCVSRMAEIENKLAHGRLVDDLEFDTDSVRIGATVTVKDEDGDKDTYTLVGPDETDPAQHKISIHSPIGKALLGHKVGDDVEITLPRGTSYTVKVLKIER